MGTRNSMKNLMRVILGLGLALVSAGLLILSFSINSVGFLILVSFVPMLISQYCILPEKIASLSPALAISVWLGAVLIPIFGKMSIGMAVIPLIAAVIVFFTDQAKRGFHERTAYRWFVLEGIVGWVGLEMIRSFIPAIGTWLFVGYPLWEFAALLQPLSVLGIYGLDLLIMATNYAVGLLGVICIKFLISARKNPIPKLLLARTAGIWMVLLLIWLGMNSGIRNQFQESEAVIRVAAIQPNLPRAAHRDSQLSSGERIGILAEMTRQAVGQGAELVVWPEMVLGFDPKIEQNSGLIQLAQETGAYIVVGYVIDEESGFRNEAVLLTPAGEILEPYGKAHPMITSGEPRSTLAGNFPTYETAFGKLGIMICFDAHFTDVARSLGRQGVQLIANPALFGASIADMTVSQVVFRAIENRTAVVMADVAFSSAIIDPYGGVVESTFTPEGGAAIVIADVPLGEGKTFYARTGDWLGWLSLIGLICFIGIIKREQKKYQAVSNVKL